MEWGGAAYNWLSKSVSFVASTTWRVWDALKATPEVVWHFMANPKARQITNGMLHVVLEDLIPFLYLHHALTSFQKYITDVQEEGSNTWSSDFLLQAVNYIFQSSFFLYSIRQRQRFLLRTSALTIENSYEWSSPKVRKTAPFTICEEEKCSDIRFIHGSIRDLGVFYLTEAGIFLLGYVPVVGPTSSKALSIYHKGRYALASVIPEVCQRHTLNYLDDNRALALSLGVLHKGSTYTISQLVSIISNLPAEKIENMIDFVSMIPIVAAAARLELPSPNKLVLTKWKDPLAYYERFMGWWVDVVLYGLKKKVPKLLNGPETVNYWGSIFKRYKYLYKHPASKLAAYALINDTFHSVSRLKQDPVIRPTWSRLCENIAEIAEGAVSWGKSWTVRTLTFNEMMREFSIRFAHWYKQYPKSFVELVVKAIINKDIQIWLLQFAKVLRNESKTPNELSEKFFLRQAQSLGHMFERALQINHNDAYDAALIMIDSMFWGADQIRGVMKGKSREMPVYPFNQPKPSTCLLASINLKTKGYASLAFKPEKAKRPSKLSIFTANSKKDSLAQNRANHCLRPNFYGAEV